jgi:uncharacterized protein YuzE
MKIQYDSEVDALSIKFIATTVTTQHLTNGIALDYDTDGHLAGIEILDAKEKLGSTQIFSKIELENFGIVSAS